MTCSTAGQLCWPRPLLSSTKALGHHDEPIVTHDIALDQRIFAREIFADLFTSRVASETGVVQLYSPIREVILSLGLFVSADHLGASQVPLIKGPTIPNAYACETETGTNPSKSIARGGLLFHVFRPPSFLLAPGFPAANVAVSRPHRLWPCPRHKHLNWCHLSFHFFARYANSRAIPISVPLGYPKFN